MMIKLRDICFFLFGISAAYTIILLVFWIQLPDVVGAVRIGSINVNLNETLLVEEIMRMVEQKQ